MVQRTEEKKRLNQKQSGLIKEMSQSNKKTLSRQTLPAAVFKVDYEAKPQVSQNQGFQDSGLHCE